MDWKNKMNLAKLYLLDSAPVKSVVDTSQKAKKLAEDMIPPNMYDFLENDKVQSVIEFGKGAGKVVAINTGSSSLISLVGFSAGGVVKGSIAAVIHSSIGSVGAGTAFATLQSMGALGVGILGTAVLPVAVGAGIVYATIPLLQVDLKPKL